VAEACEYQNSFLSFRPTAAVILNIDRDHLDFFKDTDDIISSFRRFAMLTPENGVVIINGDDENCHKAVEQLDRKVMTFGFSEQCDVRAENTEIRDGSFFSDVLYKGKLYCRMQLRVPGRHNLMNALASAAVAIHLGVPSEAFAAGIGSYNGVGRRFEFKKNWREASVYDDYSHHPTEIAAALKAARELQPNRVICVFQPHTYSRTVSLLDDFAGALKLADKAILCPIYAARETNTYGISSQDLADRIPGAVAADDLRHAAQILGELVQPGDLIFTMGAGDVNKIVHLLN
jgi:UDP-N-acetylmuramate--alanine ligase